MGVINIDDLRPGMVLASAVTNRRGRTLLAPGCEITEKQLRILRMWGITEADVEGVEREEVAARATADLDPALRAQAETHARQLFFQNDLAHPAMAELFRLCVIRKSRRLENGSSRVS